MQMSKLVSTERTTSAKMREEVERRTKRRWMKQKSSELGGK